jgi:hypothetical protein
MIQTPGFNGFYALQRRHDTMHNDTQHNNTKHDVTHNDDTQHNDTNNKKNKNATLSFYCPYAGCHV